MARMLPGIQTVEQHQQRLRNDPDAYRPERCRRCGKTGLHHHGHYQRNAARGEGLAFSLKPLFIPRSVCPQRCRTCSRLPVCLTPSQRAGSLDLRYLQRHSRIVFVHEQDGELHVRLRRL